MSEHPPLSATPYPYTYNGLKCEIVYIDDHWNPVAKADATMRVIIYADGGKDIELVPHAK
jgi:hypothetical protein